MGASKHRLYHHIGWENHMLSEGLQLAGISVASMNAAESVQGCPHQQPAGCAWIRSH